MAMFGVYVQQGAPWFADLRGRASRPASTTIRTTGRLPLARNSSQNTEQQKADQQKKKAAEDAYKAGLQRIPDAKEKYDPWRGARGAR
jgi:hypothetical protein